MGRPSIVVWFHIRWCDRAATFRFHEVTFISLYSNSGDCKALILRHVLAILLFLYLGGAKNSFYILLIVSDTNPEFLWVIYSDEQALHALATYSEVDHAIGPVATLRSQSTSRIIYMIAYLSFKLLFCTWGCLRVCRGCVALKSRSRRSALSVTCPYKVRIAAARWRHRMWIKTSINQEVVANTE